MELVQANPEGGRRLVLGFDAGCMTCSQVAERLGEASGEKLETMSLSDPLMAEWRRRALGEDAPWAPTLVEIGNGKVRAWTGVRMGARLARNLGPAATWRVAKVLGEMRGSGGAQDPSRSGLTRSQFLTGLGGAVVGMSVLSGVGSLAATAKATAAAEGDWLSRLSSTSSKELSEKQAVAAWAQLSRGRHLRRLFSTRAIDESPAASRIRGKMLSDARAGAAVQDAVTIKGVSHTLKGGGKLLALAYQDDDALVATYRFDKPGQETRLWTRLLQKEDEETALVVAEAEDGDVFVARQDAEDRSGASPTARGRACTSGSQCWACYGCKCVSVNLRCAINCCGPCALSCGAYWSCLGCLVIWCWACQKLNRCCTRRECRYISGC